MTKRGEFGEMCDCEHYRGEHFPDGPCGGERIPRVGRVVACPCEGYR